jgi:hydroxypyruvate isomerase
MPSFAANLSMMFTEWAFLDRFAAAAEAGFTAVEVQFPYDHPPDAIAEALDRTGVELAMFNLPPGDLAAGERGFAALPGRLDDVKAGLDLALAYIEATKAPKVRLMAGMADARDPEAHAAYRTAAAYAADRLAEHGVTLLLEPINGRDLPGYFLNDFAIAEAVIGELNRPNLKLQFDIYHRQIMHGDVSIALRALMQIIGHIQIASVPSRNEPDREELNYPFLFEQIDLLGYDGYVGAEYNPRGKTVDGLDWFTDAGGRAG